MSGKVACAADKAAEEAKDRVSQRVQSAEDWA